MYDASDWVSVYVPLVAVSSKVLVSVPVVFASPVGLTQPVNSSATTVESTIPVLYFIYNPFLKLILSLL